MAHAYTMILKPVVTAEHSYGCRRGTLLIDHTEHIVYHSPGAKVQSQQPTENIVKNIIMYFNLS